MRGKIWKLGIGILYNVQSAYTFGIFSIFSCVDISTMCGIAALAEIKHLSTSSFEEVLLLYLKPRSREKAANAKKITFYLM